MTYGRQRRYARPLLSAAARRPAGIALACAVLVLAGGAVLVHDAYADPVDRGVDQWAARLNDHAETLRLVADLGQEIPVIVIMAVILLTCLAARRVNGAVLAAVCAPTASVATEKVLKPLADHLYVYASYPSGHTTGCFALIATTAVLLLGHVRSRARSALRIAVVVTTVLIGCAIGVAVIALADHRFIDVVGGAAVGVAVVLTAAFLLDLPVSRRMLALAWPTGRRPAAGARRQQIGQPVQAPSRRRRPRSRL
jgi:membrane-associated phospholipid phosphatase